MLLELEVVLLELEVVLCLVVDGEVDVELLRLDSDVTLELPVELPYEREFLVTPVDTPPVPIPL